MKYFFLYTTSLLLCICVLSGAKGQSDQNLKNAFTTFSQKTLQEKVFLHTDRTSYVVGETVWFKGHVVDGEQHKPLDLSKIVYVEIVDKDKNSVAQAKMHMKDGRGKGAFVLPTALASGNYWVRAYTNWMKNFSPDFYFETKITILNPFLSSGMAATQESNAYDLQFFPEGGNLLTNVPGKVGFRATDSHGKGIVFKGALLNQRNDTVARFEPVVFGIGNFVFTPATGTAYRAVLTDAKGRFYSYAFPEIQSEGYAIQVKDSVSQWISIEVTAKNRVGEVSLLAHTRQHLIDAQRQTLNGQKAIFVLNKSDLAEGISHLTLFDSQQRPVCERLYFKRPQEHQLDIQLKADQSFYPTRDPIQIDVTTQAASAKPVAANLSLSVYLLDSLQNTSQPTIDSYLWLTSDLKGTIESPEYYFQQANEQIAQATDNLMLTHGWSRFRWQEVIQDTAKNYAYLPEYGGHFITGKLLHTQTGQPARNIRTFLSAPDKQVQLSVTKSDAQGQFRFEVKHFEGAKDIVLQTDYRMDSLYRFEINTPFSERFSGRTLPPFVPQKSWKEALLIHSMNMQTRNAFMPRWQTDSTLSPDSLSFYDIPHEKYFLDAYTRFPTVEEVMREYVPGVAVRKQKGKFHFYVLNLLSSTQDLFVDEPLILLDGVPLFDMDKVMAFDPLKIKKLEVITGRYFLGHAQFSGVVSYFTYKGDLAGYELDKRALIQSYEGVQTSREFYAPKYDSDAAKASRLPDFRNLLYWNPNIQTSKEGNRKVNFYASDQQGKYLVVIQGITEDGSIGSKTMIIEVRHAL